MHNASQRSLKNVVIGALFLLIVVLAFLFANSMSQVSATADDAEEIDGAALDEMYYMPILSLDPTPTPNPIIFQDDFSNPSSGWPIIDNTSDPSDCFKWEYINGVYRSTICDDRTDVKVSPGVNLPNGDYEITADARFVIQVNGWWTAYGIMFDAKDDPNPANSDLGDYYMLWVLYEGEDRVRWQILNDFPGGQEEVTGWDALDSGQYDYGDDGMAFNTWRIVRRENDISIYLNNNFLKTVSAPRPRTNNQVWFGLYTSTYETNESTFEFDNYTVKSLASTSLWYTAPSGPTWVSGEFGMEALLPKSQE